MCGNVSSGRASIRRAARRRNLRRSCGPRWSAGRSSSRSPVSTSNDLEQTMTVKPQLVIDYARDLQQVQIASERAEVVAAELERLVAGSLRVGAQAQVADDPSDFLAALVELRDKS